MKKNAFYWSPYLGKVATIRSVINSMIGLKIFYKNKYDVSIINCYGEWDNEIFPLDKVMEESYRILKPGGTLICFYDLWKIETLKNWIVSNLV